MVIERNELIDSYLNKLLAVTDPDSIKKRIDEIIKENELNLLYDKLPKDADFNENLICTTCGDINCNCDMEESI